MLERILPGEEATSALSESLLSAKIITFPYFIGHQKKKKKAIHCNNENAPTGILQLLFLMDVPNLFCYFKPLFLATAQFLREELLNDGIYVGEGDEKILNGEMKERYFWCFNI